MADKKKKKKEETAVWDYESEAAGFPADFDEMGETPERLAPRPDSGLTDEERLEILEEFRRRQLQGGPGANVAMTPGRGPLLTDSTEGALTQLGRGTGAALDEWDQRTSFEMPSVPGHESSDAPRFSPVAGTVKSLRKGLGSIDDAFNKTIKQGEELEDSLTPQFSLGKYIDEAKSSAERYKTPALPTPARAQTSVDNLEELELYKKLIQSGKTPEQAEATIRNIQIMDPRSNLK